jgi:hypothetical protein
MTLRLPAELEVELRAVAEEDRRSVHQTGVLAIELFLAASVGRSAKSSPASTALASPQIGASL